jgi:RHS repeat-associated protein
VLDSFTYGYSNDKAGRLHDETDKLGQTRPFAYDSLDRLVTETHPDWGSLTTNADRNHNLRIRITTPVVGTEYTDYQGIDANNKLLWVNRDVDAQPTAGQAAPYALYTYDAQGRPRTRDRRLTAGGPRQRHQFNWDGADKLRSVVDLDTSQTVFTALYGADGLRTSKTDSYENATHDYTWGPGGIVHDTANGGTTFTPGLAERRGSTDKYVHEDWLGSTRYLSDSTGLLTPNALRFDGYGRLSAHQGGTHPTEFQWAGGWGYQREWSSSTEPGLGLDYLQQRYYDPQVGRFLTPDPIGFAGGFNLYAYVENDSVGRVDPDGLYSHPWVQKAIEWGSSRLAPVLQPIGQRVGPQLSWARAAVGRWAGQTRVGQWVGRVCSRGGSKAQPQRMSDRLLGSGKLASMETRAINKAYTANNNVKLSRAFRCRERPDVSRDVVEAYREMALRAVEEGIDKGGVQADRLKMLNEWLRNWPKD